ncbi:hypothetical protein OG883_13565 [Streptomyces sp. NBC_01142]|uniref:terpene synthase family protein n=1 Tax=Streptomyces sp. NBC_01142 TaxID=2975865 RepID=UPI00224DC562|nr:hypothetical protein [Streptomyces sp. NBC_01142]MCX4820918.1 hypothetical protein [Streptomyces sp. NBC_01142]
MKNTLRGTRPSGEPSAMPSLPADVAQRQWAPSDRAVAAQRQALEWLHRHELAPDAKLREQIEGIHVGAAFVMLFPNGTPEIQELASDVFTWITAFGDVLVDGRESRDRDFTALMLHSSELLHGTADTVSEPGTGFAAALADILRRSEELLPPEHAHRVRQSLNSFVMTQNWHVNMLANAVPPDLADYVVARRHLVGGWALIALLGPLENFRFSDRPYRDPRAVELNKAACNLLAWLNDLRSYERESRAGDAELSLPSIVVRDRNCTLQESLAIVAEMCDAQTVDAQGLVARSRRDGDLEMADYGELVCGLMGHFAYWHATIAADRYR